MNVYCYYENLGDPARESPVIDAWKTSWCRNGWNPIVLGRDTAMKHPRYAQYRQAVSRFPTVNSIRYEMACYVRHLCMYVVGGGLLTDYDVMNIRYRPEDLPADDSEIQVLEPAGVPCAMYGSKSAWEWVINVIEDYRPKDNENHVSDMMIMVGQKTSRHYVCLNLDYPDWESARLIHFHNEGVKRIAFPITRSSFIEQTLNRIGNDNRVAA